MELAWCPPIVSELIQLAELRYSNGADMDSEIGIDEDEPMDLELAEPLAAAAEESGVILPEANAQLVAVLERDSRQAPARPRFGVVLETTAGGLAIGVGRGMTIESSGASLAIIERPEPDRYARAWFIPEVFYWEES